MEVVAIMRVGKSHNYTSTKLHTHIPLEKIESTSGLKKSQSIQQFQ